MTHPIHILGIESSCDDTSVAIVKTDGNVFETIFEKTASQTDLHAQYGGVIPELAGRAHCESIGPLLAEALQATEHIDAIAVTCMPGLITGLHVGVEAAKSLSYLTGTPLIGVHHIEGHIMSPLLNANITADEIQFPLIALVVSGGHTQLIHVRSFGSYEVIGDTRDDAAGECFDKIGKMMGFAYPGGPKISKAAVDQPQTIDLPRPMIHHDSLDFSFAGLKTAARYYLRDTPDTPIGEFASSVQAAIVDTLVSKTHRAALQMNAKTVFVVGGVSANPTLRTALTQSLEKKGIMLIAPELSHCTDNAAMIACAAARRALKQDYDAWNTLAASPSGTLPS